MVFMDVISPFRAGTRQASKEKGMGVSKAGEPSRGHAVQVSKEGARAAGSSCVLKLALISLRAKC